jgi:hypothetical protein
LSGASNNFGSVDRCALCQAAEDGEIVPPEVVESLTNRTRTSDGIVVSRTVISPPSPEDIMIGRAPKVGFLEYWVKVISVKTKAAILAAKEAVPESKKVAREKRKGRVFDREESTFSELKE